MQTLTASFSSFLAAANFTYHTNVRPVRFFRAGKLWYVVWSANNG